MIKIATIKEKASDKTTAQDKSVKISFVKPLVNRIGIKTHIVVRVEANKDPATSLVPK